MNISLNNLLGTVKLNKLTESEIQQAKKTLERTEQSLRRWPNVRWLLLIMGLMSIATTIFSYYQIEAFAEQSKLVALGVNENRITEILENMVEVKADLLRKELTMYVGFLFSAFTGVTILIHTFAHWSGNIRTLAMIAYLRNVIESHDKSKLNN